MLFTSAGRKVFLFVSEVHWQHPHWGWKSDAGHALRTVGEGMSQAGVPELEKLRKELLIREEFVGFLSFLLFNVHIANNGEKFTKAGAHIAPREERTQSADAGHALAMEAS